MSTANSTPQHSLSVDAKYGGEVDVTVWTDADAALITLCHHGITASVILTRQQLADVADASQRLIRAFPLTASSEA